MTSLQELPAYRRLALDVESADGTALVLGDGTRVLDLYGGHCVNTLGAGDAGLGATLARQWQALSFTTNLLDHPARAEFLEAFGATLPALADDVWQVFCSNSGSEANENALKLALAASGRDAVVCFEGAFHGRTAGAAAVTDGKAAFPRTPFEVRRVPWSDLDAARQAIDTGVGAVILEPIQSMAGVREPGPGFLEGLREACDAAGAALVFDEVQTANGRLGAPSAAVHYGVTPDVLTTAKGAAGGLPIGLSVARAAWVARCGGDNAGGHFGSTFGGGPLVLAAAAEVARRVSTPGFAARVRATGAALCAAADQVAFLEGSVGVGLLLGLRVSAGTTARCVRDALLERGVLTGLCNDPRVLRLSPALTLDLDGAAVFADALRGLELPTCPA